MKRLTIAIAATFTAIAPAVFAQYDRPYDNRYDNRDNRYDNRDYRADRDFRGERARVLDTKAITDTSGQRQECWNSRAGHYEEVRDPENHADKHNIAGTVGDLKIAIDVTHPHIGCLSFILVSPSWKEVELNHFRSTDAGGLLLTQDSKVPSPLLSMVGQPMRGSWTLLIVDRGTGAPAYTGFFHKWSMEIAPAL